MSPVGVVRNLVHFGCGGTMRALVRQGDDGVSWYNVRCTKCCYERHADTLQAQLAASLKPAAATP